VAARKRKSKTPWGWIAFGVGLAACVGVGGVVGVMLGKEDSPSDADARRVAALALDARGLNEDALSLSRAIEEAIAREELEGEAESLRTELTRLDARAERIRVRTESETDAAQTREVSRAVQRGLGEISNTVRVIERDVVDNLEPVLDEPSSVTEPVGEDPEVPDPSFEEELADVTRVLEEQGEAMTALAEDLEESGEETDKSTTEDTAAGEENLVSGSFEGALVPPGSTLEFSYELESLKPEVDAPVADEPEADVSGADPEEATITSAAAGGLILKNTGSARESFDLPTFHLVLYWKESDVPPSARDAELRADSSAEEGLEEEGAIEELDGGDEGEADVEGDPPCRYEIEGDVHCALVRLAFGEGVENERNAAGELVLNSDDEVDFDTLKPDGSLTVSEGKADSVADFLESRPPDLVEVRATDPGDGFRPACVVPLDPEEAASGASGEAGGEGPADPYGETAATILGLLAGDGGAIFEVEETDQPMRLGPEGEPEAPECYTPIYE